jgi:hypothetical protein
MVGKAEVGCRTGAVDAALVGPADFRTLGVNLGYRPSALSAMSREIEQRGDELFLFNQVSSGLLSRHAYRPCRLGKANVFIHGDNGDLMRALA